MVNCRFCGSEVEPSSVFCRSCGRQLRGAPLQPKGKVPPWLIAIIVIVVGGMIIVAVILQSPPSDNSAQIKFNIFCDDCENRFMSAEVSLNTGSYTPAVWFPEETGICSGEPGCGGIVWYEEVDEDIWKRTLTMDWSGEDSCFEIRADLSGYGGGAPTKDSDNFTICNRDTLTIHLSI